MTTWRVTHSSVPDGWNVKSGGRNIRSGMDTKQAAVNLARARASQGDTFIVERRNGSKQKEVTISSSNEDRLDMNQGDFDPFDIT